MIKELRFFLIIRYVKSSHAGRRKDDEPQDGGGCKLDWKTNKKNGIQITRFGDVVPAILENIQTGKFLWNFAAALLPNFEWNSASLKNGITYSFELSPSLIEGSGSFAG